MVVARWSFTHQWMIVICMVTCTGATSSNPRRIVSINATSTPTACLQIRKFYTPENSYASWATQTINFTLKISNLDKILHIQQPRWSGLSPSLIENYIRGFKQWRRQAAQRKRRLKTNICANMAISLLFLPARIFSIAHKVRYKWTCRRAVTIHIENERF